MVVFRANSYEAFGRKWGFWIYQKLIDWNFTASCSPRRAEENGCYLGGIRYLRRYRGHEIECCTGVEIRMRVYCLPSAHHVRAGLGEIGDMSFLSYWTSGLSAFCLSRIGAMGEVTGIKCTVVIALLYISLYTVYTYTCVRWWCWQRYLDCIAMLSFRWCWQFWIRIHFCLVVLTWGWLLQEARKGGQH